MEYPEQSCHCGKTVAIEPATAGFFICEACWKMQLEMLQEFKKNKRNLYPSIDQITDNIYLGNEDAAVTKEILEERKISHILVSGNYLDVAFPNDYVYKILPLNSFPGQNIKKYFEEGIKFVHSAIKEGKNVLVHCAAGVNRSATMTIAYLMVAKSWSADEACLHVKSKRPIVGPNSGFRKQLKEFEEELKSKPIKLDDEPEKCVQPTYGM